MVRIALGIGSNLDRRRHIQGAIDALSERFGALALSPVYRTEAVGFEGPDFFNLVCTMDSDLDVEALQAELKRIELSQGRARTGKRYESRTLDIDILLYGDAVLHDRGYDIPRGEITRYAFVLKPLSDLMPEARHPDSGENYRTLWQRFSGENHAKLEQADWSPGRREADSP